MTGKKKILIVDDGRAIRYWTQSIFAKHYSTEQAADGEEALAKLPLFKPDLILLDVEMPRLNGLETCRMIRKDPLFRYTKIIFVSGNVTLDDRLAGYDAGGDDYVTKPYDEGELFAKVKTLLRLKDEQELNHLKSSFLALISHETRTPINGILGCAELLLQSATGKERQLAECVVESSWRLHKLIENVLLFSRLKAAPGMLGVRENVKVGLLVREKLEELGKEISAKELAVSVTGSLAASVTGVPALLARGIYYVLENAVKYSPVKGEVVVDVEQTNRNCIILVSDQGRGIRNGFIDTIFDEFCVQDLVHHQSGLGISLAIARHIFQEHGGNIHAENRPEGGALFTMVVPAEA